MGSARRQCESQGPRPTDPRGHVAEYLDASFLDRLGIGELTPALANFWPARGPQWNALGRTNNGDLLIVEAKAHIDEMLSPDTQASGGSRGQIEAALKSCTDALDAIPKVARIETLYQLANCIAHLWFLLAANKPARLVLVNFLNDDEMDGPVSPREWDAAYQVALHVLGLKRNHALARYLVHLHSDVRHLGVPVE